MKKRTSRPDGAGLRQKISRKKKIFGAGIVAAVMAVVAVSFIAASHAASFEVALEAENGTLQTATAHDSTGASGGKSVAFTAATGGGGGSKTGGCIAPAGLTTQDLDPAHAGTGGQILPWPHKLGDAADIYYDVSAVPAEYAGYINDGAAVWNASPCINIHVVNACPAASNCVKALMGTSAPDNPNTDGRFVGQFNASPAYLASGTITMYTNILNGAPADYRKLVVVHEMGHSVSLGHRLTSSDIMYWSSQVGVAIAADQTNLNNILAIYGVQSAATSAAAGTQGIQPNAIITRQYD